MFGLSAGHLLILGVVLLILGPKRLPELAASIGKAMRSLKTSLEMKDANEDSPSESSRIADRTDQVKPRTVEESRS